MRLYWIETWFYFPRFGKVKLPVVLKALKYKPERLRFLLRPHLKLHPYFYNGDLCFSFSFRLYPFWINIAFHS